MRVAADRARCAMLPAMVAIGFVLAASGSQAPPEPEAVLQAKEYQLNLDYNEAEKRLRTYAAGQPDDLRALNLLATVLLYREMFRRGLLESQLYGRKGEIFKPKQEPLDAEFQQRLLTVLADAQGKAEQRLKRDPKDKEAMYWAGVTHGTRATFEFTLHRAWLPALHEAKDATRYHRELIVLDPAYVDALLIVGVNDYVVGSLPWYVKALAALAGAHGDRSGGLAKVKRVAEYGNYAREDARFMLDVLYQREKMLHEALAVVEPMTRQYPRNFLLRMELGSLYREMNETRKAADVYDDLANRHAAGEFEAMPTAKILWIDGQLHEALGEPDNALALYQEAAKRLENPPFNYRAQLAAAQLYSRMNRHEEARRTYEQVAQTTPDSDEGKLAKKAMKR
jgi:predicted Zn-dependent protease